MNPYPFASLNHFTVPVAIPVMPFASGSLPGGLSDCCDGEDKDTFGPDSSRAVVPANSAKAHYSTTLGRRLTLRMGGLGLSQRPRARRVTGEQGGLFGREG